MKQKFTKFLKKHGAYEAFVRNSDLPIDTMLAISKPEKLILGAFSWVETKEGFEYWESMHYLWKKELAKPKVTQRHIIAFIVIILIALLAESIINLLIK